MTVELYTDGSCLGNPGNGGYAAILKMGEHEKIIKGSKYNTTNNIMELYAVIEGLRALKRPCEVVVYTDSQYIVKAFNENWIGKWERSGWVKSDKKPVKNKELWKLLLELYNKQKNVQFVWVKGHDENEYNNKCDEIARNEALSLRSYEDDDSEFEEIIA